MRPRPSPGKSILLLALLFAAASVQARVARVSVASVRTDAGALEQIELSLDWPDGASSGQLRLRAGQARMPALAFAANDLEWNCSLESSGADAWRCAGAVRVAGKGTYPLTLALAPEGVDAELRIGRSRLALATRTATPDLTRLRLERLPVAWLQAFAETVWADGRWREGRLDGEVQLRSDAADTLAVEAELKLTKLALETPDGAIAAAGVNGQLHVSYAQSPRTTEVSLRGSLKGGELLAAGLYTPLPTSPGHIALCSAGFV